MLAPNLKPKSMLPLKPKNQLNASPLAPNWVRRVQVGSKNRSKIDQKRISTWEGILASIFDRFCSILGAKLGPTWEGKSSQERPRQAKTKEDKGSEGKGRERKRKGRDWKGKVWKSVEVQVLRAGEEGFTRPLGGHLPRTQDPLRPAGLERLIAIFLLSWRSSFFIVFRCLF